MTVWRPVAGAEATRLEAELARELSPGHVLRGRVCRAVARWDDRDDVAYDVTPGGLAIVHLTYRVESDPAWPMVSFVDALPEDDAEDEA